MEYIITEQICCSPAGGRASFLFAGISTLFLSKAESAALQLYTQLHRRTHLQRTVSLTLHNWLARSRTFTLSLSQRLFHFVALFLLALSLSLCLCCSAAREIVNRESRIVQIGGFYSLVFVWRLAFLFCLSNRAVVRTFKSKRKNLNLSLEYQFATSWQRFLKVSLKLRKRETKEK